MTVAGVAVVVGVAGAIASACSRNWSAAAWAVAYAIAELVILSGGAR